MVHIEGCVAAPKGFRAAGVRCGLKQRGLDVALIYSEVPAACAALFTTNKVKAAPVVLSTAHARTGRAQAIVANSGSANACTGPRGLADASQMADLAAERLGISHSDVLVCSTGVIGRYLDMEKVERGIRAAARVASEGGGADAAAAIMTTDTRPKMTAYEFEIGGTPVRIGGVAKGAGMICPKVATLLAFVTTDAAIKPSVLRTSLERSVEGSLNSLTIDGDTSTNDSVIALANGAAGNPPITGPGQGLDSFQSALDVVSLELAREVARDGEGATKFVEVVVKNAASSGDARAAAMAVANSPLVKTAIFGKDPNWGRILAAAGRSGAALDPDKVDLYFGDLKIVEDGVPLDIPAEAARSPLSADELAIILDLKVGDGSAHIFTCDFSYDYVKINAEYHT